jgi:hypothetical protein
MHELAPGDGGRRVTLEVFSDREKKFFDARLTIKIGFWTTL